MLKKIVQVFSFKKQYKKLSILFIFAMVSGCGFSPVYQTKGGVDTITEHLGKIHIHSIPEKEGLALYNYLVDQLNPMGRPSSPKYRLIGKLDLNTLSTAIKRNNEAKRGVIQVQGYFELITHTEEKTFKAQSECGYTITDSPYATDAAEQDAKKRCAIDIGRNIHTQLSLYFSQRINQESK